MAGIRTVLIPPAVSISNMPSADARHSPRVNDEDVAAGEDDGEALHPFADGAVLERRRTGRARGHRAASECTEVGRHRRKPSADLQQRVLHAAATAHRRRRECDLLRSSSSSAIRSRDHITGRAWRRRSTTIARRPAARAQGRASTPTLRRSNAGARPPLASPPAKCAASSRNRAISAGSRSSSSDSADGGLALARDRTSAYCSTVPIGTARR